MLSDTKLRNAKATGSPYKVTHRDGMYAYVSASGAVSLRYDYRLNGKRETLTLGKYPDVSLALAGERHAEARSLVSQGKSPAKEKRTDKITARIAAGNTFRAIAEVWMEKKRGGRSASWAENNRRWLDRDIYPVIGDMPMDEIEALHVLSIMEKQEAKGHPKSAEYIRGLIVQVFRFAIVGKKAKANPASDLRGAVFVPDPKHREPLAVKEIPVFMEKLDAYPGLLSTKLATKLLMLTFVRKTELGEAKKEEFDLDRAEWRIPAERMKMRDPHIVPLSRQAVECVRELLTLAQRSEYLLPHFANVDKPMSGSTFNSVIDKLGYGGRFTPHGFRATASTNLNEQGFRADVIERQLAHTERNRIRGAYNHADYMSERRQMMQAWADYIDVLCAGGKVIAGKFARAA